VIGLIGGIGAGKSRVAAQLAERGAFVVDADAVGHALLNQTPVRARVLARFGTRVVGSTGDAESAPTIDRRALGAIVFANPSDLRALEGILHPRMRKTFERAIARAVRKGQAKAVVLDAAVLLEAGWDSLCDLVVYVDAPEGVRLPRLSAQRGWTEAVLRTREAVQWPSERKRRLADAVIVNDSGLEPLGVAVDRFWAERVVKARGRRSADTARATRRVPAAASHAPPDSDGPPSPRRR
jgi:dephospho-CoA kinase